MMGRHVLRVSDVSEVRFGRMWPLWKCQDSEDLFLFLVEHGGARGNL